MRYREEVAAKIFNYITVIVLLGIIAFEAYMLQSERNKLSETKELNTQLNEDLIDSREINYELRVKNLQLESLSAQWKDYAAFTDTNKLDRFKKDLFGRTELIPQEISEKLKEKKLAEVIEEIEGLENESNDSDTDAAQEKLDREADNEEVLSQQDLYVRYEIMDPEFSFTDDQGKSVFLPFAYNEDPMNQYLVYTCAYTKEGDIISLLYELPMNKQKSAPRYNTDRKIDWKCIAYDIGNGWEGCYTPKADESEEF